jgi:hypothetical protein
MKKLKSIIMEVSLQVDKHKKPPKFPLRPKSQNEKLNFFKKIEIMPKPKSALDNYQNKNTSAIKPAKSFTNKLIIEIRKKTAPDSPLNQDPSLPKRSHSNDYKGNVPFFDKNKSRNASKIDRMQEVLAEYEGGL